MPFIRQFENCLYGDIKELSNFLKCNNGITISFKKKEFLILENIPIYLQKK